MKVNGIDVVEAVPEGWMVAPSQAGAPSGYVLVINGKSRFTRPQEYRHALVPKD